MVNICPKYILHSDLRNTSMDHAVWRRNIFVIQVERIFKTLFTLTHLSLKIYRIITIHSGDFKTVSISDLTLHCRWSTNYVFSTNVRWIRNVMFVNVVYVILRCRTSCKPRNYAVTPIKILIVYLACFNKQHILAFADSLVFFLTETMSYDELI